jgi:broad specificity phosphatase PhoE
MPNRGGNLFDVNVFAFEDVFEQRPAIHRARLMGRRLLHVVPPPLNELHFGSLRGQPERHIDARNRSQDVGNDAVAAGKPRHFIEQQRRMAHFPLVDVNEATDLLLMLGALDRLKLPRRVDGADPIPQILVGHSNTSRILAPMVPNLRRGSNWRFCILLGRVGTCFA